MNQQTLIRNFKASKNTLVAALSAKNLIRKQFSQSLVATFQLRPVFVTPHRLDFIYMRDESILSSFPEYMCFLNGCFQSIIQLKLRMKFHGCVFIGGRPRVCVPDI